MKGNGNRLGYFVFLIFIGAIGGSILGDILGNHVGVLQFLKTSYAIGTSKPLVLDLKTISMTFGINFNLNLMTIIGIILAIIFYRKY